jgi:hypothetical protein
VLRTQRYLRQPLSALAGIAGGVDLDAAKTAIDPLGDCFLVSCPATSPRRTASGATCATGCAVPSAAAPAGARQQHHRGRQGEGPAPKGALEICASQDAGARCWRARLRCCGQQRAVGGRDCRLPALQHVPRAGARGAAAARARWRPQALQVPQWYPGHARCMPLPFECEGYICAELERPQALCKQACRPGGRARALLPARRPPVAAVLLHSASTEACPSRRTATFPSAHLMGTNAALRSRNGRAAEHRVAGGCGHAGPAGCGAGAAAVQAGGRVRPQPVRRGAARRCAGAALGAWRLALGAWRLRASRPRCGAARRVRACDATACGVAYAPRSLRRRET